jgi:hypothetical protein
MIPALLLLAVATAATGLAYYLLWSDWRAHGTRARDEAAASWRAFKDGRWL